MAYRLSIEDDVRSSVRRVAREQLEGAIAQLTQDDGDPADAVHEARKHLKKARALLRLARPAIGRRAYRRENGALRDVGLSLSGTRDADVLLETVDKLAERDAGQLPASVFAQVRDALAAERSAATDGRDEREGVAAQLRDALARVDDWPLDGADWDALLAGAARSYGRGRAAFALARANPSVVHLHEWRKRVKDLWYHERLLAPAWPEVIGAHGEQAHRLSELLGDEHDLAMLRGRLDGDGLALPQEAGADVPVLLALVDERRAQLRGEAFALGGQLYAEKPKAFARRFTRHLRTALAEQPDGTAA